MGDRFYTQQKQHKPGRRLKKDVIKDLENILNQEVLGIDRLTIKTLDALMLAVINVRVKQGVEILTNDRQKIY